MLQPASLHLPGHGIKPRLRGLSHLAAFFTALGAGAVLVSVAPSPRAAVAALVYSLGLAGMYGTSGLYHVPTWSQRARLRMRRLDHAMIFVQIAGTYTPLCLLALPQPLGAQLLAAVWLGAGLGMVRAMAWAKPPRWLTAGLYLALGWAAVLSFKELLTGLGPTGLLLIALGGLIYSAGAVVYALRRPNPWPRVFGYHEVFHVLVIVASVLHFIVVRRVVIGA
ncbi:MAG: hemolysin III family protein [Myxococcota bacterium]|nr:hemolysin III family protein [Myxococcota bacterium]